MMLESVSDIIPRFPYANREDLVGHPGGQVMKDQRYCGITLIPFYKS